MRLCVCFNVGLAGGGRRLGVMLSLWGSTMKTFFSVLMAMVFCFGVAYADPDGMESEPEGPKPICPVTQVEGDLYDCLKCHTIPNWKIKEVAPYADMKDSLPAHCKIVERNGGPALQYFLTNISDYDVSAVCDWFGWHPDIRYLVVEVQSPGGSLFASQRIVGMLDDLKAQGVTVETRCYGFAASAGFYIFVNGSPGYRFVAPQSQLMWHELISFKMFDVSGPADKEDEARVLRHLQDTTNERIASVSKVTKEDLDHRIRKKELWVNGYQAVEDGFADHLAE